jgi:hypothetical protein
MDMHFQSVVVTLVGADNKPFREYDPHQVENGRRCNLIMPFDTEYKVFVKNLADRRIKLDIEVDGTNVSGKGLIIGSKENAYIERFVDAARKFKFVKAQGAGANPNVADPTSPENGIVKIRVAKEKQATLNWNYYYNQPSIWTSPINPYPLNPEIICYGSQSNPTGTPISCSYKGGAGDNIKRGFSTKSMSFSSLASAETQPKTDVGATVEGNNSGQSFGTTYWNGDDGDSMVFTFYVRGVENGITPEEQRQYEEYLRLKEKFG